MSAEVCVLTSVFVVSLLVGVVSLKGSWVYERGQLSLRVKSFSLRGPEQRQPHPRQLEYSTPLKPL